MTGAPSRSRPCSLLGFNQALYLLSYRCVEGGATYGIRTHDFSLDGRALWPLSQRGIRKGVAGAPGFEPGFSRSKRDVLPLDEAPGENWWIVKDSNLQSQNSGHYSKTSRAWKRASLATH
jgi:hypothetical protein